MKKRGQREKWSRGNSMRSNDELVNYLVARGVLKTPRIIEAFRKVDRAEFVLPAYRKYAYFDDALPHLAGQSIPQPSTVAIMLELLRPTGTCFDLGTGSGYTAALLANLCDMVYTIEIFPELYSFAEERLKKYKNVKLYQGDGSRGIEGVKFDRILVTAEAPEVPAPLVDQLKPGGRIVIPVSGSLVLGERTEKGFRELMRSPGFAFVPLRGKYGREV